MKTKTLLIFVFLFIATYALAGQQIINGKVTDVIDGDSIVVEGNQEVRILGIDAPEHDEPWADEARDRTKSLVLGKGVKVEVCKEHPTDSYGRILGVVKVGKKDVGATLISEGLAFRYILHPCGTSLAPKYLELSNKAEKKGKGVWSSKELAPINADLAAEAIDKRRAVEGIVKSTYRSRKGNMFLNFGPNYKTDFTIFISQRCSQNFQTANIDPVTFYKQKFVRVRGRVFNYNGPEIKVCHPEQIELR